MPELYVRREQGDTNRLGLDVLDTSILLADIERMAGPQISKESANKINKILQEEMNFQKLPENIKRSKDIANKMAQELAENLGIMSGYIDDKEKIGKKEAMSRIKAVGSFAGIDGISDIPIMAISGNSWSQTANRMYDPDESIREKALKVAQMNLEASILPYITEFENNDKLNMYYEDICSRCVTYPRVEVSREMFYEDIVTGMIRVKYDRYGSIKRMGLKHLKIGTPEKKSAQTL